MGRWLVVAMVIGVGCGSSGGGGGTGGAGGTGGSGASGSGGAGGGAALFEVVAPCNTESSYATGDTVTFGPGAAYSPKCLVVSAGASVTFSGDFSTHPLEPSAARGTLTGNPIRATTTGTSKSFTFPTPGFWAYYCSIHGPSDSGAGMVGVVWAR